MLFSVDEIGDSERIFGEMRQRIRLTVGKTSEKTQPGNQPKRGSNPRPSATSDRQSLMLAGNEFQSLGRAIVKQDEYEEVRWDGLPVVIIFHRVGATCGGIASGRARRTVEMRAQFTTDSINREAGESPHRTQLTVLRIIQPLVQHRKLPSICSYWIEGKPRKKPQPGNLPRPGFEPGPPGFAARSADRYSTGVDTEMTLGTGNITNKPCISDGSISIVHLDFFPPNLGAVSDEHEKRYQEISEMERRYRGESGSIEHRVISDTQKSKVMAFFGQDPDRSKIIHNNQCLEQVQNFNYLGCEISYQNEKDVNKKITKFTQILGIINNALKAKLVQKSTRIKIYNTLALPFLLYGSEIWSLKKKDMNRIKAMEMKFLRRTAGYTLLDRKRNEEILEQLEVESVEEKISRYKFNWLDHVRRMENSRIPKIMTQYKPRGHRRPGRPLRGLLDGAETGLQRPNS
ncbi:hypothetical protein ANN_22845 [Periplaneta americana]|uniref:Reverse transcriptase domain-containing protein n=1 Tax=Periplaneta americana TaxID=6978 RepID=A0ABQ8SJG5_PERAM|nr:hypothetical protein ANN_22845 [Periplaneta americana]